MKAIEMNLTGGAMKPRSIKDWVTEYIKYNPGKLCTAAAVKEWIVRTYRGNPSEGTVLKWLFELCPRQTKGVFIATLRPKERLKHGDLFGE